MTDTSKILAKRRIFDTMRKLRVRSQPDQEGRVNEYGLMYLASVSFGGIAFTMFCLALHVGLL
jgi:hypothetical protein